MSSYKIRSIQYTKYGHTTMKIHHKHFELISIFLTVIGCTFRYSKILYYRNGCDCTFSVIIENYAITYEWLRIEWM